MDAGRAESLACVLDRTNTIERVWSDVCSYFARDLNSVVPCHKGGEKTTIELKRILAPTDFSEYSAVAIAYACAMADKFDAELHLLHILEVHADPTPLCRWADRNADARFWQQPNWEHLVHGSEGQPGRLR